ESKPRSLFFHYFLLRSFASSLSRYAAMRRDAAGIATGVGRLGAVRHGALDRVFCRRTNGQPQSCPALSGLKISRDPRLANSTEPPKRPTVANASVAATNRVAKPDHSAPSGGIARQKSHRKCSPAAAVHQPTSAGSHPLKRAAAMPTAKALTPPK